MLIGERLRAIREAKKLSQGDIEQHTGLIRCYASRIENGHSIPSLETLEKFAQGFDVPLYQLFYEGTEPPNLLDVKGVNDARATAWGTSRKAVRTCCHCDSRTILQDSLHREHRLLPFSIGKMI